MASIMLKDRDTEPGMQSDSLTPLASCHAPSTRARPSLDLRVGVVPARPENILDVVDEVFYRLDLDGHLRFVSAAVKRFGHDPDELVGSDASRLYQAGLEREEILTVLLAQGYVRDVPVDVQTAEGSSVPGLTTLVLRHDETGLPSAVEGVLRDGDQAATLQRAVREAHLAALDARRSKTELLAVVSHELRTPLNAVTGMCELMRDTDLTPSQRGCVESIDAAGRTLLGMVNDILQFAAGDGTQLPRRCFEFNLHGTVAGAVESFAEGARRKDLDLDLWIEKDVPPMVCGDRTRIEQIMVNLIGNAVKFTRRGGVTVHVSRLPSTDPGLRIRFEVIDTGIGIAPHLQTQVFEPFVCGDTSTTRPFQGIGIGLALARRVAEMIGAEVGLVSVAGKGSTFWLNLPLDPVAASEAEAP